MSTSDPNSSASTPAALANTIRTPPSQQTSPTPPPLPPPYRAIAPIHYPNSFQQAHTNRLPNSPHQLHHQDPSTFVYPFASPDRGYSTRPVRVSSPFVAENQSGYPPRPVMAYNHRQFGPGEMESMMQFMRARNPQIHQVPYTGSGSPVGSGPMRGVPHFLQPRSPLKRLITTDGPVGLQSRDHSDPMQVDKPAGNDNTPQNSVQPSSSDQASDANETESRNGKEKEGGKSRAITMKAILEQIWKDDLDSGRLLVELHELYGDRILPFIPSTEMSVFL